MVTKQLNVRVSGQTHIQIKALAVGLGTTEAGVVEMAVDRLARQGGLTRRTGMAQYIVGEGSVTPFDGVLPVIYLPDRYGVDWIVVQAAGEADALEQANLYDRGQHSAQTEMEMFASVLRGLYISDGGEAALRWAGWQT